MAKEKHHFKHAWNKTIEFLNDKEKHERIRRNLGETGRTLNGVEHGIDNVFGIQGRSNENTLEGMRHGVINTLPKPKRKGERIVVRRPHPAELEKFW
jgi:hypothetical protein